MAFVGDQYGFVENVVVSGLSDFRLSGFRSQGSRKNDNFNIPGQQY